MHISMSIFGGRKLAATLALLGSVAMTNLACAEEVGRPPKASSIEIVIGSGAGASPDIFTRRIAQTLADEKLVDIPIVIQNRTGGAWTVAGDYVLKHPGSEAMLFGVVGTIFTTPIVQGLRSLYDKITPVALITRIDIVLLVKNDSPYKNFKDYMKAAAASPRAVSFAGANVGSTDNIIASLINKAGNVELNYIPFDGGGGAIMTAFLGGTVDSTPLPLVEAWPLIKSGEARPIAIFTEERRTNPEFKDVPTAKEQGFDVVWGQWFGLAGPPNLDPAVATWWADKLKKMVESDTWKKGDDANFLRTEFVSGPQARPEFDHQNELFRGILTELGLAKVK